MKSGGLTQRQAAVAALTAQGSLDKEIAQALGISVRTVERHQSDIRARLKLRTRVDVVIWWLQGHG